MANRHVTQATNIGRAERDAPREMVHVRMTRPEGSPIAEFEMPMTDAIKLFLDKTVFKDVGSLTEEPNAKLAASLEEAANISPRFSTAQELFDALDRRGQT